MKKLLILLILVFGLGLSSTYAAVIYSPSQAELLTAIELDDSPTGVADLDFVFSYGSLGATFIGDFDPSLTQFRTITVGGTPSGLDLSGYDYYSLRFENTDNNDSWLVRLYLATAGGGNYTSAWENLTGIDKHTLNFDLSGVSDLGNITKIGFIIGFNESTKVAPGSAYYQGDSFNLLVKTMTPEPTSMLLLGMGVLGLFGLKRRKS